MKAYCKILLALVGLVMMCASAMAGEKVSGIAFLSVDGDVCFIDPGGAAGDYKTMWDLKDNFIIPMRVSKDGTKLYYVNCGVVYSYSITEKSPKVMLSDTELKKNGVATFDIEDINDMGGCLINGSDDNGENSSICFSYGAGSEFCKTDGYCIGKWSPDQTMFCYKSGYSLYLMLPGMDVIYLDGDLAVNDIEFLAFGYDSKSIYYNMKNVMYKYNIEDKKKTKLGSMPDKCEFCQQCTSSAKTGFVYSYLTTGSNVKIKLCGPNKVIKYNVNRPLNGIDICSVSPDEKYLLFKSSCDDCIDNDCIYIMDLDTQKIRLISTGSFINWITADKDNLRPRVNSAEGSANLPKGFIGKYKFTADFDGDGQDETAYVSEDTVPNAATPAVNTFVWMEKDGAADGIYKRNFPNGDSSDPLGDYIMRINKADTFSVSGGKNCLLVKYDIPGCPPLERVVVYGLKDGKLYEAMNVYNSVAMGCFTKENTVYVTKEDGIRRYILRYVWNGEKFIVNGQAEVNEDDEADYNNPSAGLEKIIKKHNM